MFLFAYPNKCFANKFKFSVTHKEIIFKFCIFPSFQILSFLSCNNGVKNRIIEKQHMCINNLFVLVNNIKELIIRRCDGVFCLCTVMECFAVLWDFMCILFYLLNSKYQQNDWNHVQHNNWEIVWKFSGSSPTPIGFLCQTKAWDRYIHKNFHQWFHFCSFIITLFPEVFFRHEENIKRQTKKRREKTSGYPRCESHYHVAVNIMRSINTQPIMTHLQGSSNQERGSDLDPSSNLLAW